jgi:hypothetical protein
LAKCFLFDQVVSEKKVLTYKDTDNNEKQVVKIAHMFFRNYTTLDKYTTHDAKGCVPAGDSLPGSKVTCMCHVNKDIWIGTSFPQPDIFHISRLN